MGRLQQGHAFHSHQACPKVSIPKSSQTTLANDDSYDLPDDVFVEGETRPTRTKKTKAGAKTTEPANKKRSLANAGLDVGDHRLAKTNLSEFCALRYYNLNY